MAASSPNLLFDGALLGADDPHPVAVTRMDAPSPFLMIGDHAGRAIPRKLARLGLPDAELNRHIAWDIGVSALGAMLSEMLAAPFIEQTYSRLVIDCNRAPGAPGSILTLSDGARIPGNENVTPDSAAQRVTEIFAPYQARIAAALDARAAAPPILVALHSFTPVMTGFARPWRFGVLHRDDAPFARAMLRAMREDLGDLVGDNEPYQMHGVDHTIPLHVDARSLDYVELEVRQDLIGDDAGRAMIAPQIAAWLTRALAAR